MCTTSARVIESSFCSDRGGYFVSMGSKERFERDEVLDEFATFFKEDIFPDLVDEDGKGIEGFKAVVEARKREVEANVVRREEIRRKREEGSM